MKKWKNDVAVLLIFFCRDEVFSKTFAAVREARPSTLLLFQDGPREGRPDDIEGIKRCRTIAENIDWECTVYRNYQDKNFGCDPATFYSHKWAFTLVDKCIILEDDCVPSQSFFPFCKEMLDRYEKDLRINRIAGMNLMGVTENCPYDYMFSSVGSVWGWATWRRVAQSWEEDYAFADDEFEMNSLRELRQDKGYTGILNKCKWQRATGKPYWESINTYARLLNSQLIIVPKYNMISNIGNTENATHGVKNEKLLPKHTRKMFSMKLYELQFPLKHPKYVLENPEYKKLGVINATFFSKLESIFLRVFYGDFTSLKKGIKRRLHIK